MCCILNFFVLYDLKQRALAPRLLQNMDNETTIVFQMHTWQGMYNYPHKILQQGILFIHQGYSQKEIQFGKMCQAIFLLQCGHRNSHDRYP